MSKKIEREHAKELLSKISEKMILEKSMSLSSNLAMHLKSILKISSSLSIGGFSPIQKECLWFKDDFFVNQTIYVPTITTETQMVFVEVEHRNLDRDELGLKVDEAFVKSAGVPDVLLIPGLLFDRHMNRLGRGAGYYDRYLETFKGIKIGVCFEEQLVDELKVDKNDIKVDLIITEKDKYIRGIK